jgi:hypothetical protein
LHTNIRKHVNRLAIASIILSLISAVLMSLYVYFGIILQEMTNFISIKYDPYIGLFIPLIGIVGVVCGVITLVRMKETKSLKTMAFPITGIVVGSSPVLSIFAIMMYVMVVSNIMH